MKHPIITGIALLAVTTLTLAASDPAKHGKSYKWVDKQGVTHYGDSVPPEYAQGHTSVLNPQGVELKRTPAQLSAPELAAASTAAEIEARNQQHDQFLLTTYTSTRDIEQLRDERLSQIEGQVVVTRGYIEAVAKRVVALEARAMSFKPYSDNPAARRMPDALAEEIVRSVNEGKLQRVVLETKQAEQREMRVKFQTDIDRYQALVASRKQPR